MGKVLKNGSIEVDVSAKIAIFTEGTAQIYYRSDDTNIPGKFYLQTTITNQETVLTPGSSVDKVRIDAGPSYPVIYEVGANPVIDTKTNDLVGATDPFIIKGKAAASTAGSNGGDIDVNGAAATAGTTTTDGGVGGDADLTAGDGGAKTDAGDASGGAGGASSVTAGNGGATASDDQAAGGAGGAAPITAGDGGAASDDSVGGAGGVASLTGGAGGATAGTATDNGGAGGAANVTAGAGGAVSSTGGSGGAGGSNAIAAGAGGATAATSGQTGGAGGDVTLTAAPGGAASAGTSDGGAGGTIKLTPGTGGTSAGGTAGVNGVIIKRGIELKQQGAPAAKTTSATLTAAEILTGIITLNQGAAGATAQQLCTGTALDTALPDAAVGDAFDFSVINISTTDAEDGTITTNTGWTLVGSITITANNAATEISSATFRARRTAAATWTLYRLT